MHSTNSVGSRISLLNEEPLPKSYQVSDFFRHEVQDDWGAQPQRVHSSSYRGGSSDSGTPDPLRSDWIESSRTTGPKDAVSPSRSEMGGRNAYAGVYQDLAEYDDKYFPKSIPECSTAAVESMMLEQTSSSFEDDLNTSTSLAARKRCPCRFRNTHNCDKTFTTSGHASRHSKIHTAKKCVQCSFKGCNKSFTRADNMKHHLETHYKERSRSSSLSYKSSSSSNTDKPMHPAGTNPYAKDRGLETRPGDIPKTHIYISTPERTHLSLGISPTENNKARALDVYVQQQPTRGLDTLVEAMEFQGHN